MASSSAARTGSSRSSRPPSYSRRNTHSARSAPPPPPAAARAPGAHRPRPVEALPRRLRVHAPESTQENPPPYSPIRAALRWQTASLRVPSSQGGEVGLEADTRHTSLFIATCTYKLRAVAAAYWLPNYCTALSQLHLKTTPASHASICWEESGSLQVPFKGLI